jgi:integrase
MKQKGFQIPENLSARFNQAYSRAILEANSQFARDTLHCAIIQHLSYCENNGLNSLTSGAILNHFDALQKSHSYGYAQRIAYSLVKIARNGPDKISRDELYSRFLDKRTGEQILCEPYIPPHAKIVGMRLLKACKITKQDLQAYDHYCRVLDRLDTLPLEGKNILDAFWNRPSGRLTKYRVLKRAADMIDLLHSGHADANRLRAAQRAIPSKAKAEKRGQTRRFNQTIVELVARARQRKKGSIGKPYSEATQKLQLFNLQILERILSDAGLDFSLDRSALAFFSDYAAEKFEAAENGKAGWSAVYISGLLKTYADFVPDPLLREDILFNANQYRKASRFALKAKEKLLFEKDLTLKSLFKTANNLLVQSRNVPLRSRPRYINIAAILALLCCYPLRRSDLVRLRFGVELQRSNNGWSLNSFPTQKTGIPTYTVRLPEILTPFLDAALLQGTDNAHLWDQYTRRKEACLWSDWKTDQPLTAQNLSINFKNLVGCNPHLLRTIWVDYLTEIETDTSLIAAMLQHDDCYSQHAYEVAAQKHRLKQAVEALAKIAEYAEKGIWPTLAPSDNMSMATQC